MFTCFYILFGLNVIAVVVGHIATHIAIDPHTEIQPIRYLGVDMNKHYKSIVNNIALVVLIIASGMAFDMAHLDLSVADAFYEIVQTISTGLILPMLHFPTLICACVRHSWIW